MVLKLGKVKDDIISVVKWGVASVIAILISNYVIAKLVIVNNFLVVLLTATIISIIVQAVRSHDQEFRFRMKWFIFYFLIYAIIISLFKEYVFLNSDLLSSILSGLTIGLIIVLVQHTKVKSHTIPWISFILILLLIVINLNYIPTIVSKDFLPNTQNSSELSEEKRICPSTTSNYPLKTLSTVALSTSIKTDVWRIEHNFGPCYSGRYAGQRLDRFYCDDMIVSRWDTSGFGTINYKWYTTATAEWRVDNVGDSTTYTLESLTCENGKKVTVNKQTKDYYVHVARDGTEIKVEY